MSSCSRSPSPFGMAAHSSLSPSAVTSADHCRTAPCCPKLPFLLRRFAQTDPATHILVSLIRRTPRFLQSANARCRAQPSLLLPPSSFQSILHACGTHWHHWPGSNIPPHTKIDEYFECGADAAFVVRALLTSGPLAHLHARPPSAFTPKRAAVCPREATLPY